MKIEKINENQIRCTLSRKDLTSRQLDLSELAYGTEKARSLFHEMIQQASEKFGFEAEDIPLMIEAIPLSGESIMLIITKIEDPEELDTRFSKFAPSADTSESGHENVSLPKNAFDKADDILDIFNMLLSNKSAEDNALSEEGVTDSSKNEENVEKVNLIRVFKFESLDIVTQAAQALKNMYYGFNTLYKDPKANVYYLVVNKTNHTPVEFNQVCNILTEYGKRVKSIYATEAYYAEHYDCIIENAALQRLSLL